MKTESINNGSITCCRGMPAVPVETPWVRGPGVSWPCDCPFLDKAGQGVSEEASQTIGGWDQQRQGEGERGERWIFLPPNALSLSSPRAAGKSTSDFFPQRPCCNGRRRIICQHGVLFNCRLTKSWVSTPRSASCRSISGDQAVSLTESLTEKARSDWELVSSGQQMF